MHFRKPCTTIAPVYFLHALPFCVLYSLPHLCLQVYHCEFAYGQQDSGHDSQGVDLLTAAGSTLYQSKVGKDCGACCAGT
jgi:hypothetical protein